MKRQYHSTGVGERYPRLGALGIGVALLMSLTSPPPVHAKKIKKSFQSQTAGNELFSNARLEFIAPIAPDGSEDIVGVTLTIENRCAPWPSLVDPPRLATVGLAPKGPTTSTYEFEDDFDPCSGSGAVDPAWNLANGASVGLFSDGFNGTYCTLQLNPPPAPPTGRCGNGVLNPPELCDDGNNEDGDGCSSICFPESLRSSASIAFDLVPGTLYQLNSIYSSTNNFLPFAEGDCLTYEICLPDPEVCGNGEDDDCNGLVDEAGCFPDSDGDGAHDQIDCSPLVAEIYPGAQELCNGIDDDCDGIVDNDADGDGLAVGCDLCPDDFDPTQPDTDRDGLGNACDPDVLDPLNPSFGEPARALFFNAFYEQLRVSGSPSAETSCRATDDIWHSNDGFSPGFSNATSFTLGFPVNGTLAFGCTSPDTEDLFQRGMRGPDSEPHMAFDVDVREVFSSVGCERAPRELLVNHLFTAWDTGTPMKLDIAIGGQVPASLRDIDPLNLGGFIGAPVVRSGRHSLGFLDPLSLEFRSTVPGRSTEVMGIEVLQAPAPTPQWTAYLDADGDGVGTEVDTCLEPETTPWIGWAPTGGDCDDTTSRCTDGCEDFDADGLRVCDGDCNDFDMFCTECPEPPVFADDMEDVAASEAQWTRQAVAQDPNLGSAWEITTADSATGARSWRVQNSMGFTFSETMLISPPIEIPASALLRFSNRFEFNSCMGTPFLEYGVGDQWVDITDWVVGDLRLPTWQDRRVPLTSLAGSTVRFRWRYSQNNDDFRVFADEQCGLEAPRSWYVDNIRLEGSTHYYFDDDGDGAGDPAVAVTSCSTPFGYVDNNADACPQDASKTVPGGCGCGIAEIVDYAAEFGSRGGTPGQFNNPRGIALAEDGTVYVADRFNNRVQVFNADGDFIREVAAELPLGIDLDSSGRLWVAQQEKDSIAVFNAAGVLQFEVGGTGSADDKLNEPLDLEIDDGDQVFVVDRQNNRIQVFDDAGEFKFSFGWGVATGALAFEICDGDCNAGIPGGGKGQFSGPVAIAVDDLGRVYVGDSDNQRVQVFSNAGSFLFDFGVAGTEEGQFNRPLGIDVDAEGRIWVSDFNNHRIQVFSGDGRFQFMFGWGVATGVAAFELCSSGCQAGLPGSGAGQFNFLLGLAVDDQRTVYVTDFNNHRVQTFVEAGLPNTVAGLQLDSAGAATRLSWEPQPPATGLSVSYGIISGPLSELRSRRSFANAALLVDDLVALTFDDNSPQPSSGDGEYYLIRARTPCDKGTFGDASIEPDPRDELDEAF